MSVVLETPRLRLEPLSVTHAEALFDGLSNPALYDFVPQDPPASPAEMRNRFARVLKGPADDRAIWQNWAIKIRQNDSYAGFIETTIRQDKSIYLAYFVFISHWRQGIAREGVRAVLEHLRAAYGAKEVIAEMDTRNLASIGLVESLGFTRIGETGNADFFKGQASNEYRYRLALDEDQMITLDHLVVAARTLEEGAAWVEQILGVATQPGGKHARMGTHNRLLNLGNSVYLEIIAIDPDGAKPIQPRWFALDSSAMQARLANGTALIHWVARSHDIERDAARSPVALGIIHAMERGDFRWRITIPADGHLPGDGLVPTLIQWDVDDHPAKRLPDSGCRLVSLRGSHPEYESMHLPAGIWRIPPCVEIGPISRNNVQPFLEAVIATPGGNKVIAA